MSESTLQRLSTELTLYLEIRPFLRVAHVTLHANNKSTWQNASVTVNPSEIIVQFSNQDCSQKTRFVKFDNITLKPDSCSCLNISANILSFRLQLKESLPHLSRTTYNTTNIIKQQKYIGCCSFCNNNVFRDDVSFTRILPLPPEEVLSSASEWFCHPVDGIDWNERLKPRADDCLVSDDEMQLASTCLEASHFEIEKKNVLCRRCRHRLGSVTNQWDDGTFAVRFCLRSLHVRPRSIGDCKRCARVDARAFWLTFDRFQKACRVVVRHDDAEILDLPVLLVQLMDNSVLYAAMKLTEDAEPLRADDCHSKKILYMLEKEDSATLKQWGDNTESLHLKSNVFVALVENLMQNTSTLPHAMQKLDIFWIAYISDK